MSLCVTLITSSCLIANVSNIIVKLSFLVLWINMFVVSDGQWDYDKSL